MKYKSHDFTTVLAKTQASNAGRERAHPIILLGLGLFYQGSLCSSAVYWMSQRPKSEFSMSDN